MGALQQTDRWTSQCNRIENRNNQAHFTWKLRGHPGQLACRPAAVPAPSGSLPEPSKLRYKHSLINFTCTWCPGATVPPFTVVQTVQRCQRWFGPPNGVHARISHCPAWHLQAHPHIPRMSQPAIFGKVVCLLLARLGAVCIVLYTPRGAHTCPKHPILPPLIFTSHTSQDVLLRSGPPCELQGPSWPTGGTAAAGGPAVYKGDCVTMAMVRSLSYNADHVADM